jgi:hypothetical protein
MTDSGRPIKPLKKLNSLIAELTIVDADESPVGERFQLHEGANEFKCRATYVDGSIVWFEPYWTCPIPLKSGGADPWMRFGRRRHASVTLHAAARHERYSELACWVDAPTDERRPIISAWVALDYSLLDDAGNDLSA